MAKRRAITSTLSEEQDEDRRVLKIKILAETKTYKLCSIAEQSHRGRDFYIHLEENPETGVDEEYPRDHFTASNGITLASGSNPGYWPSDKHLICRGLFHVTDENPFNIPENEFFDVIKAVQEYNKAKAPGDCIILTERLAQ